MTDIAADLRPVTLLSDVPLGLSGRRAVACQTAIIFLGIEGMLLVIGFIPRSYLRNSISGSRLLYRICPDSSIDASKNSLICECMPWNAFSSISNVSAR